MFKLTVLSHPLLLETLMQRLEEAGIGARCVSEKSLTDLYFGGATSEGVWIDDAKDLERASAILREVHVPSASTRCPTCGYSLVGHAGRSKCPECGSNVTTKSPDQAQSPDHECPTCHEQVPASFEVCWNCGGDMRATNEPHGA